MRDHIPLLIRDYVLEKIGKSVDPTVYCGRKTYSKGKYVDCSIEELRKFVLKPIPEEGEYFTYENVYDD